ncbi:MAG TPA: hypothetical protein P5079_09840, partial [Elusimicrobiota bacterium]|nr:hypothetical protein [Elusimicrobiota bacterium]
ITTRSGMNAKGDYTEVRRTLGRWGNAELDSTDETVRFNSVFDGFGRMMSYSEATTQDGLAGTLTTRELSGLLYDVDGNMVGSHEVSVNAQGAVSTMDRAMKYDPQGRLSEYTADSKNTGDGISLGSHVTRTGIAYNGVGDVVSYKEKTTKDENFIEENVDWSGQYNVLGQLANSHQVTHKTGVDTDGSVMDITDVTDTYAMTYNRQGNMAGYTEELTSSPTPALVTITVMGGMTYDDAGRTSGFTQTVHQVSRGAVSHDPTGYFRINDNAALHSQSTTVRAQAQYNSLGMLVSYADTVTENGLQTQSTVKNAYDSSGRLWSSTTESQKTGEEKRLYYYADGQEMNEWQLSALLALHPGKTVEDLVADGALQAVRRTEKVDEKWTTVRSGLSFDGLNRLRGSTDTTTNSDGTVSVNTSSDMVYDREGRLIGSRSDSTQTGTVGQLVYRLNGVEVTAEDINSVLAATGLTLWDLFNGTDPQNKLEAVEVNRSLDKSSYNVRAGITYNDLGQMIRYQDSTSDPAGEIDSQVTTVQMSYTRHGQVQTQTSLSDTRYVNGGKNESTTLLTFNYDPATGQMLGAGSVGTFTSTDAPVWSDTNQDGQVDSLVTLSPTYGNTQQSYGVFNGQMRLLNQTSSSSTVSPDGTTSTSHSTTIYIYNALGRLVGATSEGVSTTTDVWETATTSTSSQLMTAIQGEMKAILSVSDQFTENLDTSSNRTLTATTYTYDDTGKGLYGIGVGKSFADDGFGTVTVSTIGQLFAYVGGQFRLVKTDTISDTYDDLQTGTGEPGQEPEGSSAEPPPELGVFGNNWMQALAGLPFIITWDLHEQIYNALSAVLNFTFDTFSVQQTNVNVSDVIGDAVREALAQLGQSGSVLALKDVKLVRGTPTDPNIMDTDDMVTWTSDGVMIIHEDVVEQWLVAGRDIVQDLMLTILHENHEYVRYAEAKQSGLEVNWELMRTFHEESVALGYQPQGIEENWLPTGGVASGSAGGTFDMGGALNALNALDPTQTANIAQQIAGQTGLPLNNLAVDYGNGSGVTEAALVGLDSYYNSVDKTFNPAAHGYTVRTPPGDVGDFTIYEKNGGKDVFIVYREDLNAARDVNNDGTIGEHEGQTDINGDGTIDGNDVQWSATTFIHMVKGADDKMIYRTTYNLGSRENPDTSKTVEWRNPANPSEFATLTDSIHYDDHDDDPDTIPNPSDPGVHVNKSRVLMAKTGDGPNRIVGKQSLYDGMRLQSAVDGQPNVYAHIKTASDMYRYGDTKVTKNSYTVNLSNNNIATFATLVKNLPDGPLFGVVYGEVNQSNDPDAPNYVANAMRIINGVGDSGRFDFTKNASGVWVPSPSNPQNPSFTINAANIPNVGYQVTVTWGGFSFSVTDNNGSIYVGGNVPPGALNSSSQGLEGLLVGEGNAAQPLGGGMPEQFTVPVGGDGATGGGAASSSLFGTVDWTKVLNAVGALSNKGRDLLRTVVAAVNPAQLRLPRFSLPFGKMGGEGALADISALV